MSDSKMEYNWGDLGVPQLDGFASEISEWSSKDDIFITATEELPSLQMHREQVEQIQRRGSLILSQAQQHSQVLVGNLFKNLRITGKKPIFPSQVSAPKAYRFKDIYSSRKDQLIRDCVEQERKLREFRSRPMPDFRQVHERQAMKVPIHRVTCPVTPNVLKNSLQVEQRRRLKVEQLQKEQEQENKKRFPRAKPIPLSSRQALKPLNLQSCTSQVKIEPFNLSSELRVQQRRIYNVKNSMAQDAKRRELEEQRQRAEREAYQKQRQLTKFRARPNPFALSAR
ncbi:targeting protein for Xklp2 homolog [Drosophila rhopaloa]|uniref:Targeting protein for Xklp2 homolog n=1 Tax=Drosophila rhopaloa TaxID=1041015 RepID=A0A6P4FJ94_DRORH|nr:targeting protein for Xklp2 homolog [Drosophila rhopaloa]